MRNFSALLRENTGYAYYKKIPGYADAKCFSTLGVMYCNKLKFSMHVDNIVSKASLRAKLILHCFQSRDPVLLSKAFGTFVSVRPILEYVMLCY